MVVRRHSLDLLDGGKIPQRDDADTERISGFLELQVGSGRRRAVQEPADKQEAEAFRARLTAIVKEFAAQGVDIVAWRPTERAEPLEAALVVWLSPSAGLGVGDLVRVGAALRARGLRTLSWTPAGPGEIEVDVSASSQVACCGVTEDRRGWAAQAVVS